MNLNSVISVIVINFLLVGVSVSYTDYKEEDSKLCDIFETLAEDGNPKAQALLGACYLRNGGREYDLALAISWFKESADQMNEQGMASLGAAYLFEKKDPEDYELAVSLLKASLEKGYVNAAYALGMAALNGFGMEENLSLAIEYFQKAAALGHVAACLALKELEIRCVLSEPSCLLLDVYSQIDVSRERFLEDEYVREFILGSLAFRKISGSPIPLCAESR